MSERVTFRIHFASGFTVDRTAETPIEAKKLALSAYPNEIVTKIKLVREVQSTEPTTWGAPAC